VVGEPAQELSPAVAGSAEDQDINMGHGELEEEETPTAENAESAENCKSEPVFSFAFSAFSAVINS
jgi:hypothetical protein